VAAVGIARQFELALAAGDGLVGAHCIHELWMRGALAIDIESCIERLWQYAADSIPDWLPMRHFDWLPVVYREASLFQCAQRGRYHIYLVLLDYRDSRSGPYGVYVGMTSYRPAERFDQHKAGIRAAGSVLKRGLEVIAGPTLHLQRLPRSFAATTEIKLAEALRSAGLFVQGGH
jgi:hypothetical protein